VTPPQRAASDPARTPQPGADDARARLLQAGLQLFAQQGYSTTSTRELAEQAQVNVAAISYYFGDKAGLYRAVFSEPLGAPTQNPARLADPGLPLREALAGFYAGFLQPLRTGDGARLCMKLHFREMLEPTGLCDVTEALGITATHGALVALLARHLGLPEPDAELGRLAVCLAALGVHLHVGRDITDQLEPSLNQGPQALDGWAQRLVEFGLAMVQAEAARRGIAWPPEQPARRQRPL